MWRKKINLPKIIIRACTHGFLNFADILYKHSLNLPNQAHQRFMFSLSKFTSLVLFWLSSLYYYYTFHDLNPFDKFVISPFTFLSWRLIIPCLFNYLPCLLNYLPLLLLHIPWATPLRNSLFHLLCQRVSKRLLINHKIMQIYGT